ncbi:MAG TPA: hypothetical protein VGX23_35935 [Actinocrinis sp.]|nr:hypothetical protein [Actinocrinis sp.]
MHTWNLQLRLNRTPTDDEVDALSEAGLDDAAVSGDLLDVDREASALIDALTSTLSQIETVPGLPAVARFDDDPVTLTDAAQGLQGIRTAESLRLLAEGKHGPAGFPAPLVNTGKIRVYSWSQIVVHLKNLGDPVIAA